MRKKGLNGGCCLTLFDLKVVLNFNELKKKNFVW